MVTPWENSKLLKTALNAGYQVRLSLTNSSGEIEYGFQLDESDKYTKTIRIVYRKSNTENDVLGLTLKKMTIVALANLLDSAPIGPEGYSPKSLTIFPLDYCSLDASEPISRDVFDVNTDAEGDTDETSKTTPGGYSVKGQWACDPRTGTIIGVVMGGKPSKLLPHHLRLAPASQFYHVRVLGRGLDATLNKTEFDRLLVNMKKSWKK